MKYLVNIALILGLISQMPPSPELPYVACFLGIATGYITSKSGATDATSHPSATSRL